MPGPGAVGAWSSSFRLVPAPCTRIQGSTGSRRSEYIPGVASVCPARPFSKWREAPNLVVSVPGVFWGPYSPMSRRAKALGPCRCGSRHWRPWLHTRHPSRRITRNTDAGNRFERHGNRAGVAAGGRTPPVWCERMNGVLLTALSGSQPLWIRGRARFRRGNPLAEMARTMSDLHILATLI